MTSSSVSNSRQAATLPKISSCTNHHVVAAVGDHGGGEVPSACTLPGHRHPLPATQHLGALGPGQLHVAQHFLGVLLADGAADGGVLRQRVPSLHLLGLPHELSHELVEYLPLHKHP